MASKIKVDQIQTADGTGTIALQNQLSGMTNASMPSGSVLQVVQFSDRNASRVSSTSTSYVTTGISKAITPKRNNSIIIVEANTSMTDTPASNGEMVGKIKINGTDWADSGQYALGYAYQPTGRYYGMYFSSNYTVSSLSTLTFEIFFKSNSSGVEVRWVDGTSSVSMTLTEIAV